MKRSASHGKRTAAGMVTHRHAHSYMHRYTHMHTHCIHTCRHTHIYTHVHRHRALGHDFKMRSLLQFILRTSQVTWEVTGPGWECAPHVSAVPALTAGAEAPGEPRSGTRTGTGDLVWLRNTGDLSPRAGQPLSAREVRGRGRPPPQEEEGRWSWGAGRVRAGRPVPSQVRP